MGTNSDKKKSPTTEEISVDLLKKMHRQNQMIISLLKEIKTALTDDEVKASKKAVKGKNKKQYIHVVKEVEKAVTPPKKKKSPAKETHKKSETKPTAKEAPKKSDVKPTAQKEKVAKKKTAPARKKTVKVRAKKEQPKVLLSEKSLQENNEGEENPFIYSDTAATKKTKKEIN